MLLLLVSYINPCGEGIKVYLKEVSFVYLLFYIRTFYALRRAGFLGIFSFTVGMKVLVLKNA